MALRSGEEVLWPRTYPDFIVSFLILHLNSSFSLLMNFFLPKKRKKKNDDKDNSVGGTNDGLPVDHYTLFMLGWEWD